MLIHKGFVPPYTSTVVERLERAGAIILGKLSMTEGAVAIHHPDMPTPGNPWHAGVWTGASSSGSGAATSLGLCYGSLGSDTGGSIRFPSATCGLTGVKATWGRASPYGVFPLGGIARPCRHEEPRRRRRGRDARGHRRLRRQRRDQLRVGAARLSGNPRRRR